jgi:hypothetical protein
MIRIVYEAFGSYNGWQKDIINKPMLVEVIGYLMEESDKSIVLCQGTNNYSQMWNPIVIPRSCIVSNEELVYKSDLDKCRGILERFKDIKLDISNIDDD